MQTIPARRLHFAFCATEMVQEHLVILKTTSRVNARCTVSVMKSSLTKWVLLS